MEMKRGKKKHIFCTNTETLSKHVYKDQMEQVVQRLFILEILFDSFYHCLQS